ncbi:MAG: hypothetical protein PVH77_07580 [Phycisphaerales bacterium]|jgi:hypothetical protein
MKRHLTEQELIEYQFKLAPDDRMKETAGHLEECGECREHLDKLQRKFSSLDLLREEAKASEELISNVIEQAKKPVRKKIFLLRKPAWLSAAAMLAVGLLLIAIQFSENKTKKSEVAQKILSSPANETPASDKLEIAMDNRTAPTGARSRENAKDMMRLAAAPKQEKAVMDSISIISELKETTIAEKPPFAPASAIELVTLPRRDNVQLTIYNSADLTLVRERRNLTLKKGWNWLQFMWANTLIDPTSLSLEPLAQADKIEIQQLVFPARLRELGRWLIRSEVSGQVPFEITYFTSGLSWRAFYMGTLSQDEKKMHLQGYVRVGNNSGDDYENAQTRLIVGQVHLLDEIAELARRQYPYNSPIAISLSDREEDWNGDVPEATLAESLDININLSTLEDLLMRPKEIIKEGLSEYFLYTIEGTETIPNEWGKRLLSFEAKDVNVTSLYKYDEEPYGNQTIRFVKFTNDEEHNLGQTPIPNGNVKIYSEADNEDHLSYVGGANIKYIPVNEEVELNLGQARLVKVEPKLIDFKTDNYAFDPNGNIAGWDEIRTWKIKITNTRTLPVEIEITRGFDNSYWTIRTDAAYEKHDAMRARFNLNLEPQTKRTLEYIVTTYHGTREENWKANF